MPTMPQNAAASSSHGFVDLLEAFRTSGGTAPADVAARLLDDHSVGDAVSLAKLICTGQAFGFEWRNSLWVPMFQFDTESLAVRPAPQQARAELPALWPGWAVASWFATPHPMLRGQRPVNALQTDLVAVLRAARAATAQAAVQVPGARVRSAPVCMPVSTQPGLGVALKWLQEARPVAAPAQATATSVDQFQHGARR